MTLPITVNRTPNASAWLSFIAADADGEFLSSPAYQQRLAGVPEENQLYEVKEGTDDKKRSFAALLPSA